MLIKTKYQSFAERRSHHLFTEWMEVKYLTKARVITTMKVRKLSKDFHMGKHLPCERCSIFCVFDSEQK